MFHETANMKVVIMIVFNANSNCIVVGLLCQHPPSLPWGLLGQDENKCYNENNKEQRKGNICHNKQASQH